MTFRVRLAGDDDVGVLGALRRAWNEEDTGAVLNDDDGFLLSFGGWWEAERSTRAFFVVEIDGVAVGMANVKCYERMPAAGRSSSGWWGYVGNVFVLPDHRNAGVGRA